MVLVALVASFSNSFCGEFRSAVLTREGEHGPWHYEKVIDVPGTSKEELYRRMKLWVVGNIKTTDLNNTFDDKSMDLIISTPTIAFPDLKWKSLADQTMSFKMQIEIKDNKIRVGMNGFVYSGYKNGGSVQILKPLEDLALAGNSGGQYKQIGEGFDNSFLGFMETLEKAAKTEKKSSEW
ncbi:hypothetical protein GCM10023093_16550 [Nemorincola caseinilytica]|uniref:DUF4468 domain-containing protein n=1 Tax=Nemorincola caseinilytica TaxID=2054315 RepID=A0ABP8NFR5_9BACT